MFQKFLYPAWSIGYNLGARPSMWNEEIVLADEISPAARAGVFFPEAVVYHIAEAHIHTY